jgi:hypothetical protein
VRKVTAVITPIAPRPIRAASNSSGRSLAEQATVAPSASTSSSPATCPAIEALDRPVPCVPVPIAPETVCAWMSPMFVSARPCSASSSLNRHRPIPASTVTSPEDRSAERSLDRLSSRICTPSVTATGAKEWPLPTGLTARPWAAASRTSCATSAVLAGAAIRRTWAV